MVNKSRPSIEPCGTPWLHRIGFEVLLPTRTDCCLLLIKSRNHNSGIPVMWFRKIPHVAWVASSGRECQRLPINPVPQCDQHSSHLLFGGVGGWLRTGKTIAHDVLPIFCGSCQVAVLSIVVAMGFVSMIVETLWGRQCRHSFWPLL